MNELYCLMFRGKPMNDLLRGLLFDVAQEMIEAGDERRRVRSGLGEGEVTTKGEHACVGGFSGMEFHAVLDTPSGHREVRYLVRPSHGIMSNDERGQWCDVDIAA